MASFNQREMVRLGQRSVIFLPYIIRIYRRLARTSLRRSGRAVVHGLPVIVFRIQAALVG